MYGLAGAHGERLAPRSAAEQIERQPRGVPDLVREVAVALDALRRERDPLVARRESGQREAQRVGAERREARAHLRGRRVRLLELRQRLRLRRAGERLGDDLLEVGAVDEIERVDHVPLHLAHLVAGLVDDHPVQQHARERRSAHEVDARTSSSGRPRRRGCRSRSRGRAARRR